MKKHIIQRGLCILRLIVVDRIKGKGIFFPCRKILFKIILRKQHMNQRFIFCHIADKRCIAGVCKAICDRLIHEHIGFFCTPEQTYRTNYAHDSRKQPISPAC